MFLMVEGVARLVWRLVVGHLVWLVLVFGRPFFLLSSAGGSDVVGVEATMVVSLAAIAKSTDLVVWWACGASQRAIFGDAPTSVA